MLIQIMLMNVTMLHLITAACKPLYHSGKGNLLSVQLRPRISARASVIDYNPFALFSARGPHQQD